MSDYLRARFYSVVICSTRSATVFLRRLRCSEKSFTTQRFKLSPYFNDQTYCGLVNNPSTPILVHHECMQSSRYHYLYRLTTLILEEIHQVTLYGSTQLILFTLVRVSGDVQYTYEQLDTWQLRKTSNTKIRALLNRQTTQSRESTLYSATNYHDGNSPKNKPLNSGIGSHKNIFNDFMHEPSSTT